MSSRLYLASILVLVASPAWLAYAQQSFQTGAFMTDRDKAALRGPVKTVLDEQTFSGVDGQQFHMSTTTEYAGDGRILERRIGDSDGSAWVTSYTYSADGRLLKTVSGKAGSPADSQTTYLYDDARRLDGVESGGNLTMRFQYDEKGRKSAIESYDSSPYLRIWPMKHIGKKLTWGLLRLPAGLSQRHTTIREWRRVRNSMVLTAPSLATLCASSMQKVASSQRNRPRMPLIR